MDINSRNLGQQEEDLDKKKFRKRASMSRSSMDDDGVYYKTINDYLSTGNSVEKNIVLW